MKLLLALLLAPFLASGTPASPTGGTPDPSPGAGSGAVPGPGPATAVQDKEKDFMERFRELMQERAESEMVRLMKKRQDDAIIAILSVCTQIGDQSNDRLEAEVAALRKAWKTAFNSTFVDHEYEYFSLLSPSFKRTRKELIPAYEKLYALFDTAKSKKDGPTLDGVREQLESMSKAFEDIGDFYMASQTWYFAAMCSDEDLRGSDADLFRACKAWENSATNREKADLKDQYFQWAHDRALGLKNTGYGDPSKAGEIAEAHEAAEKAAAITMAPTFEVVSDLGAYERPQYNIDPVYQAWNAVYLKGNGSTAKIQTMPDSPNLIREGAAKAAVDVNGDGTGDVDVPVTGNITPVQFTVGEGDDAHQVAFLATIGRQDDTYQGFRMNLSPDESSMVIYVTPAGSMVTDLNGTSLRIFDDNLDGIYGSLGEKLVPWGFIGVREGSFEPDMDSVAIGKSKKAVPFSEHLQVGDTWYRMEVQDHGTKLLAYPTDVKTGTLKLKLKGPGVDFLVVHGAGKNENDFFDLTANGSKGVEVPVGSYALYCGRVGEGKRDQTTKALILPSEGMRNWTVEEGKTTTVELGAPFGFDFSFKQDDETVTVDGTTVVVTGQAGETYQRLWNCVVQPEVMARKVGSKRATGLGSMRPAQTQEEMSDIGWLAGWFPVGVPLKKEKFTGSDVEVQLVQKKNKLFGKIQSDWKKP